jgi:hypothetical protein
MPDENYEQEYAKWQEEELERFNRICEQVQKSGKGISLGAGKPPELNPDGSYKDSENASDTTKPSKE